MALSSTFTSDIPRAGEPLTGGLLRTAVKVARGKKLEERFAFLVPEGENLLDPWFLSDSYYASGHSKSALIVDKRPFEVAGVWREALLYSRVIPIDDEHPLGNPLVFSAPVETALVEVDVADALSEDKFREVLFDTDIAPIERSLSACAKQVARRLNPEEILKLWATVQNMQNQLAGAPTLPAPPGTDSFEYWALALIYGDPLLYSAALAGTLSESIELDELAGERFAGLAERAYLIATGRPVEFMDAAQREALSQRDPAGATAETYPYSPSLKGIYFEVNRGGRELIECVCVLIADNAYDDVSAMITTLATRVATELEGTVFGDVVWVEHSLMQVVSGFSAIEVTRDWSGSIEDFAARRGLQAQALEERPWVVS